MTTNPYLAGNFAPVEEEVTAFDLEVTGSIPEALEGRFVRIGPNPVDPDPASYHWFTGSGMVHGLSLRGGRAEWYRNRWVRDDIVTEARGWPAVEGHHPATQLGGGVANTNVISIAGRTFAVVEAGNSPIELTEDLETVRRSDFDGTLEGGFTAHPKVDPDTGEIHAALYSPMAESIQYCVVGADGRVRKTVDVPVPGKPMVHDCAITEKYFILFDLPCTFNVEAAMQGAALPYRWDPTYGARVGLLPRDGSAEDVVWSEVGECYVFHPMNAYDDDNGNVVIDVVRHPAMFATEFQGPYEGPPTLDRWTIDPKGGPVKEERFDDYGQEFPRIDERRVGKRHRFGYGVSFSEPTTFPRLIKHDVQERRTEYREGPEGYQYLEPVFVPTSPDAAEDDGWILTYVYDPAVDRSNVLILHAQDFTGEPVATIHLPQRVPYGFHGNWVPSNA